MFEIINLPEKDSFLIEASGKISTEDYTDILRPFLDQIKDQGHRVRILFHTTSSFEGYTMGGAWEDCKLGIHHFRTFEKIAVVSDVAWLRNACKFFSPLIPCPVKVFTGLNLKDAKIWLASNHKSLTCNLDEGKKILNVEVVDSLSEEDFKILSQTIDPWIANNGQLKGVIIHVKEFPYWENFSSFLSHLSFVKNHHRKVEKVALVSSGKIAEIAPKIANHFVKAEVKNFDYPQLQEAESWILGA